MTTATLQDRLLEFFTLREAAREVAAIPEATRGSVFREIRLAFQKREAAETLWPRGSTAEALQLARTSVETVTSALASFPEPHAPWVDRARRLAEGATKQLVDAHLPALEADTQPTHEELFRGLTEAVRAIEEVAGVSLAAPSDLGRLRNARIAITSVLAILVVTVTAWALHTPSFSGAAASGQLADFAPDRAIDGDPATAWVTPDRVGTGWIDLTLTKPRTVGTLHILASNPPSNDRDVKDAHIDALMNGAVVKATDVTFREPPGKDASWTDVALGAPKCDHIRITVKSNYKVSAGIAEVEIK